MRKLIWLTTLLVLGMACGAASAQNAAVNGYCQLGATSAVVSGLQSTNKMLGVIPRCTVNVYLTGTTTHATIFSTAGGGTLANPFTANATTGQWLFYASTGQAYDVVMSGGVAPNTYPSPVTITAVQNGGGGGGSGITQLTGAVLGGPGTGSVATTIAGLGSAGNVPISNGSGILTSTGLTADTNGNLSSTTGTANFPNPTSQVSFRQNPGNITVPYAPTDTGITEGVNNVAGDVIDWRQNLSANGRTLAYYNNDAGIIGGALRIGIAGSSYNADFSNAGVSEITATGGGQLKIGYEFTGGAVYLGATGTYPAMAMVVGPGTSSGVTLTNLAAGGIANVLSGGELTLATTAQQTITVNGTACVLGGSCTPSGGGGGLSGMTAGQVPIAATASTVTSSMPLAGSGPGITTGPNSGVTPGDLALFTGTGGQITDGLIPGANVVTASAALTSNAVVIGNGSKTQATISADTTTTHALFATAGAPAFRALVTGDLPALTLANIGAGTAPATTSTYVFGNNNISFTSGSSNTCTLTAGVGLPSLVGCVIGTTAVPLGGVFNTVALSTTNIATVSNNFNSGTEQLFGSYWNGSAAASDSWQLQSLMGAGTNPTSTLNFAHTGSSGAATVSVPNLNVVGTCTGCGGFASPMITLGDSIYGGASGTATRLAGPTVNGTYALTEIPVAGAAVAPTWTTLGAASKNGNYEGIAIFGDSMTVGFGSLLPNGNTGINYIGQNAPGWGPGLLGDFGSGQGLYGFSGDMAADMAVKQYFILNPQSDHNPAVAAGGGVNDNTVYGTNTNQQDTFTGTTLESMANATIPTAAKVFATQCATTGTWAAYALSGTTYPGVRTSSTNASTLTCTLITYSNGPIYIANLKSDNSGAGTASVTIDGGSVAGFTTQALANSSIATQNGLHQAPYLNRYVGPYTAGTHTIVITVTSATGALAVIPMWVGGPCLSGTIPCANAVGTGPTYFAGGVPPNSANTPTGTSQYDTLVKNAVALMAGDGLPVYFVDILNGTNTANSNTFAAVNATTDYSGGTVGNTTCITSPFLPLHLDNCGHAKTRRGFEAAMNIQRSGQEVAPTHVGLTANGFVLPFPGYNYQALNGYPVAAQLIGWGAKDAAAAGTADPNIYGEVSTGGAYVFQVNSSQIGSMASAGLVMTVPVQGTSVTSTTFSSSPHYFTSTNCSSTASPAVCGAATAGQVQIAASATSITINTTAASANSRIGCLTYSTVGLTAPTNIASLMQPYLSGIVAGTSFTLTIPVAPLVSPVNLQFCFFN